MYGLGGSIRGFQLMNNAELGYTRTANACTLLQARQATCVRARRRACEGVCERELWVCARMCVLM